MNAPRPAWLHDLSARAGSVDATYFGRFLPPARGGRASAVLMLFGPDESGHDSVVLTQRSSVLRSHAGQVAFPGGRVDPHDDGPVGAALREAHEEVGLEPDRVEVVAQLPELFVPVSDSVVTTVVGWADEPAPLSVRSPLEVEAVTRPRLDALLDPAHRLIATHPNGYRGDAFDLPGLYIWGFTAGMLSKAFELAGLERPWDRSRVAPLPERFGAPRTTDEVGTP